MYDQGLPVRNGISSERTRSGPRAIAVREGNNVDVSGEGVFPAIKHKPIVDILRIELSRNWTSSCLSSSMSMAMGYRSLVSPPACTRRYGTRETVGEGSVLLTRNRHCREIGRGLSNPLRSKQFSLTHAHAQPHGYADLAS